MVEQLYIITALCAVLVASVDALWYRRGSVLHMRWRPRIARGSAYIRCFGVLALLLFAPGRFIAAVAVFSVFSLVHRYWYNVQRDMHVDYITGATVMDRAHMRWAKLLGYHESYGGHVAYCFDAAFALGCAIALHVIQ